MFKFVFFGSSPISVTTLNFLKAEGLKPALIVTKPDAPQGRGLEIKPTVVKEWANEEHIQVISPDLMKDQSVLEEIKKVGADVGVLVSYGKIIPDSLLTVFPKGIVNLHPSLLPHLRGPAPIEYMILEGNKENVGVSIILLDSELDHGPIIAQKKVVPEPWPVSRTELYDLLSAEGAKLLAETLVNYVQGNITPIVQDNSKATFSKMIEKQHGEIKLSDDPHQNYLKYLAYEGWPGVFFFEEQNDKKIRVKITAATYTDNQFKILKVIPEGKKEVDFEIFKQNSN